MRREPPGSCIPPTLVGGHAHFGSFRGRAPSWRTCANAGSRGALPGSCEFRPGASVTFTHEGKRPFGESRAKELVIGFSKGSKMEVFAKSPTRFFLRISWDDSFDVVSGPAGDLTELTFNPGPWPTRAPRLSVPQR